MSKLVRLSLVVVLLLTLFGPLQSASTAQSAENLPVSVQASDVAPEATREPLPLPTLPPLAPAELEPVTFTAAEVERLTQLRTARDSRYGPDRNDPAQGIPAHAYSPFDQPEPEAACSGKGCDHVPGVLLVKLAPQVRVAAPGEVSASGVGALTGSVVLNDALVSVGVTSLTPLFTGAVAPAASAMVEDPEGRLVAVPDLTRWHKAQVVAVEGAAEADLTGAIESLVALDEVTWAEPDYVRRPIDSVEEITLPDAPTGAAHASDVAQQADYNDPLYAQQWHLAAANVPAAWDYLESQGLPRGGSSDVVVAVIDTGVDYNHPDIAANMWVNAAEFGGAPGVDDDGNGYVDDIHGATTVSGQRSGDPQDDHGHGTHVAGIVAAGANNGVGGVGVAYNARIMALKAAQYSGVLSSSDIAAAIYYAVEKGADIINMSFGGYARSIVEEDALTVAFGSVVLVAAAGNDGKPNEAACFGAPMYPAAHNWVLGVMASTQYGVLAIFSNKECIARNSIEYELMAPGVGIWSTLPADQYAAWAGTSMAAPVVSGMAVLARTKWVDKDIYSSRFIMAQIASNTMDGVGGRADAGAALSQAPRPELSFLQHWLFDTATQSDVNDDDGIVDAGEAVDLAIVIRNHWGKADPVTVTLEPWAEGAVFPDPYVTMITDTVDYGAIGSFNWDDNGLIYDADGVITGVRNPFRFSVAADCPNDHVIPFILTMSAGNGYDPGDSESPYLFTARFYLIVQKGVELRGLITEDMTLTSDRLWIIANRVGISPGITLTVSAGTQVQWGSPKPLDPYAQWEKAAIETGGTLLVQGTFAEPVEMFPSPIYDYPRPTSYINVWNTPQGTFHAQYVRVKEPEWGYGGGSYGPNSVDHGYLYGDYSAYTSGVMLNFAPSLISNSLVLSWPGMNDWFRPANSNTNLFHTRGKSLIYDLRATQTNNVLLQNNGSRYVWRLAEPDRYASEADALAAGVDRHNAILSPFWNPDPSTWIRLDCVAVDNGLWIGLADNFWGTLSSSLVEASFDNTCRDWGDNRVAYEPYLSPYSSTYPFVVDVALAIRGAEASSALNGPAPLVGSEPVTFTVTFNRDMDPTVQPAVSFGPDTPLTDYTVHPIDGGWVDARTWQGTFNVNPITGDGYQLIRVAGPARAADDPWLVIGDDAGRFRFEVITSGTEAMNLQANGGEGYVDLMWTQTDFDLLSGFNLYRSTSADGPYTRLNASIIPPQARTWRDTDVVPGQPYYYKFTVVKSDMTESDYSNVAMATPIDTIAPVIAHTPLTTAAPGLPLTVNADVTDNVAVRGVTLNFRTLGTSTYTSRAMTLTTGNRYSATLEGSRLVSPGLEYFLEATDGVGQALSGRADYPWQIAVVDRPVVTGVAPARGPAGGGTAVTVSGTNFKPGAVVTFGGAAASEVVVASSTQITCLTPPHYPAAVDVMVTNPDLQTGMLLRGYTYEADVASVGLPDTGGGQHAIVEVPVTAADVDGLAAASLTVHFDSAVLSAQGARAGTLTPGWSVVANTGAPGEVRLSMASTGGTVSGSGVLAYLTFEVVGAPGATCALTLASFSLNDGAIPVQTANGSFAVNLVYSVSGSVGFWTGGGVPDVSLTLAGERLYTGASDDAGAYTVAGAAAGDYTLTPTKSDDTEGITAFDASLALQHDAGLITLTGYPAVAADVNKSGAVTAMDAFHILQNSVGLLTLPFPGAGVVWAFDPASRTYTGLSANQTGQDFAGVLLGDISGNWTPEGAGGLAETPVVELHVSRSGPDPSGEYGVTFSVSDGAYDLHSLTLRLAYDSSLATYAGLELDPVLAGWLSAVNTSPAGSVRIALAGAVPVSGEQTLATLRFKTTGEAMPVVLVATADVDEGAADVVVIYDDGPQYRVYLPLITR